MVTFIRLREPSDLILRSSSSKEKKIDWLDCFWASPPHPHPYACKTWALKMKWITCPGTERCKVLKWKTNKIKKCWMWKVSKGQCHCKVSTTTTTLTSFSCVNDNQQKHFLFCHPRDWYQWEKQFYLFCLSFSCIRSVVVFISIAFPSSVRFYLMPIANTFADNNSKCNSLVIWQNTRVFGLVYDMRSYVFLCLCAK